MKNEILSWAFATICVVLLIAIGFLLVTYYFAGAIIFISIAIFMLKTVIKDNFF
jgi:membrane protein YdbS with pleckstrin-like domain